MEAPEKIYVHVKDGKVRNTWNSEWIGVHDVEYIRKDVLIEKAEDFIRRKICDYIVHYNYGPNNDMETMYVDSRFFEDFKNYMKGE